MKTLKCTKLLNQKGQNVIEYILIFSLAVGVMVFAFTPGGMFDQKVTTSMSTAIDGFECTAETACFDESCVPSCGNNCCEIGEDLGEDFECYQDCGFPCPPDDDSVTCASVECGLVVNNCGETVNCGGCAGDEGCVNGVCECINELASITCAGVACGSMVNNCGNVVTCLNTCPSDQTCVGNVCACVEDPKSITCQNVACGETMNNCGNPVLCDDTCVNPFTCVGNSCTCIEEDPAVSCAGLECGQTVNNCGKAVTCLDTCALPSTCQLSTNMCECIAPSPCGQGLCGPQVDICGNDVDCGPDCGCFELVHATGFKSKPCETTCPENLDSFICSTSGEECIICVPHPDPNNPKQQRATYRCDAACDNSCIPSYAVYPYACHTPNSYFGNYHFYCGAPIDMCGTPIINENCGTCDEENEDCVFLDSLTSQCVDTNPECLGTPPNNGVLCPGDDPPASDTSVTISGNGSGSCSSPDCQYYCPVGFHQNGTACMPNQCGPSPTSNASYWDAEETTDVPSDGYVSTVTQSDTATKCQLQCDTGYYEDFTNICDQVVCGTVPDDATLIPGDDSSPISVTERAVWVVTADTSRKCEATCDTGFIKSGNTCVPANYNQCTANNVLYRVQGGTLIGYRPGSLVGGNDPDTCPEFCESIPNVDYCEVHTYAVSIFLGTTWKKSCSAYSGGSLISVPQAYNTYTCN